MAVIFCTACGARNRRKSLNCVLCNGALEVVERLNTRVWETETELPGAIDELEPLSIWQRIYARPVLSGAVVASVVAIVITSVWLFFKNFSFAPTSFLKKLEHENITIQ